MLWNGCIHVTFNARHIIEWSLACWQKRSPFLCSDQISIQLVGGFAKWKPEWHKCLVYGHPSFCSAETSLRVCVLLRGKLCVKQSRPRMENAVCIHAAGFSITIVFFAPFGNLMTYFEMKSLPRLRQCQWICHKNVCSRSDRPFWRHNRYCAPKLSVRLGSRWAIPVESAQIP